MEEFNQNEMLEKIKIVLNDKNEINKLLIHCLGEFRKVDRIFKWSTFFENMIRIGIIDDDEASRNYQKGLSDFYRSLLDEIKVVENSDLNFISFEDDREFNKEIFHDDLVIGISLLNDVSCYTEEEVKIIKMIGGCMLRKHKHDETIQRLKKMGDNSHLFDDPIEIRFDEKKKNLNDIK